MHKKTSGSLSEISIICWILPISEKTRKSNRKLKRLPSERWVHTRNRGGKFNNSIKEYIVFSGR